MGKQSEHINPDRFFEKVEAPFAKSKDELWELMEANLEEQERTSRKGLLVYMNAFRAVAAAIVLMVMASAFFARFYKQEVVCHNAERLEHVLPDGSKVELNAGSSLSLHPYWWFVSREVTFAGEGFFSVQKGKRFTVKSQQGSTEVLGTSFNIYARDSLYKVFCSTGKVKVTDRNNEGEWIIHPDEMAVIGKPNTPGYVTPSSKEMVLNWKADKLFFSGETLRQVMAELERQYDVKIQLGSDKMGAWIYSGYFTQSKTIEPALYYICTSFELSFEEVSPKTYRIIQSH